MANTSPASSPFSHFNKPIFLPVQSARLANYLETGFGLGCARRELGDEGRLELGGAGDDGFRVAELAGGGRVETARMANSVTVTATAPIAVGAWRGAAAVAGSFFAGAVPGFFLAGAV